MAKRSHGDCGIDQRGEDIYRLRYRVAGQRFAKTFHGTMTEARKELRRLQKSGDDGQHVDPAKKTLREWADEWIKLKTAERRAKTVARYAELLARHVLPKLGDRQLQQIKPIEIQLLYAELSELAPRVTMSRRFSKPACKPRSILASYCRSVRLLQSRSRPSQTPTLALRLTRIRSRS
jgi:integrase